jgi:hypothetical protein
MFKRFFGRKKKNKQQETENIKLYLDFRSKSGSDNFEERCFQRLSELKKFIDNIPEDEYYICIILRDEKIDYGNLHLWVKGDNCKLRLDEHQEHYYPPIGDRTTPKIAWIKFFDGYEIPTEETLTYQESIVILYDWLDTGSFPRFNRYDY